MQYVVPATDLTAVIFLLIILYEVLFENKNRDDMTKRFRLCLGLAVLEKKTKEEFTGMVSAFRKKWQKKAA